MTSLEELDKRIQTLEKECLRLKNIEEIQGVKYHYWYCLDNHLWDEIGDCFAEESDIFGINLRSRKSISRFFKRVSGQLFTASSHQGHNPEIILLDETKAIGHWQLDQFGIESNTNTAIRLGAFYSDLYIKEGDRWRIKSTNVTMKYRQILTLDELPKATREPSND